MDAGKTAQAAGLLGVLAFGAVMARPGASAVSSQQAALAHADRAFIQAAAPRRPEVAPLPVSGEPAPAPAPAAPAASQPPMGETPVAEALPIETSRPDRVLVPVEAARMQYPKLRPTAPVVDVWQMGSQPSSTFFAAAQNPGGCPQGHGGMSFRDRMPDGALAQAQAMDAQLRGR